MKEVPSSLPMPFGPERGHQSTYLTSLQRLLFDILALFAYRINRTLPKDGSEAMEGPLELMEYVDGPPSTVPAAASYEGTLIYVSDGVGGQKLRFSDGSSWLNVA